jgi:hypothetical protein
MPHGVMPPSYNDLALIINELRADLNALRQDFRRHDHGNTASYVQAAITIRAIDNTFSGSPETSSAIVSADIPISPVG